MSTLSPSKHQFNWHPISWVRGCCSGTSVRCFGSRGIRTLGTGLIHDRESDLNITRLFFTLTMQKRRLYLQTADRESPGARVQHLGHHDTAHTHTHNHIANQKRASCRYLHAYPLTIWLSYFGSECGTVSDCRESTNTESESSQSPRIWQPSKWEDCKGLGSDSQSNERHETQGSK